jgi:tetratricopeptide (TPR) repeat protein
VRSGLTAWGVALLTLLPHCGGLANGFVYDDFRFFVENPGVHALARPIELLCDPARASSPLDRDIWRPLRTLLFAGEHALFGGRAAGWHATSLLLHLLLVRALIALAGRLPGATRGRALAAGLLFGVHPLSVESVAWVSSQGDLLAALFSVACIAGAGRRPLLASAAAALALLSKESALPLVLALLAARRLLRGDSRPRPGVVAAAAVASALYLLARQAVLERGLDLSAAGLSQRDAGLDARLLQFCQNLPLSLRRFLWPWPLSIDYDARLIGEPGAGHVVLALALLAALAFALFRRPGLRERCGLPLLLAFLFLLPASGLLVALKSPMAERFLLLPCAGLALAAAAACPQGERSLTARRVAAMLLPAAVLLGATLTFLRTRDFRSEEALWRAELAIHPQSVQARLGLMHVAAEAKDLPRVLELGNSILALTSAGDARGIAALFGMGRAATDAGLEDEGARLLELARDRISRRGRSDDLDPGLHLVYVALGNWRRTRLSAADAEVVLREGVERFGRHPRLLEGLGVVRDQQGDATGAEALYREALAAGEESATLRYHLGLALVHLGRAEEAMREVERALTLDPSHVPSRRLREELSRG